jgi:hypothetical protein
LTQKIGRTTTNVSCFLSAHLIQSFSKKYLFDGAFLAVRNGTGAAPEDGNGGKASELDVTAEMDLGDGPHHGDVTAEIDPGALAFGDSETQPQINKPATPPPVEDAADEDLKEVSTCYSLLLKCRQRYFLPKVCIYNEL